MKKSLRFIFLLALGAAFLIGDLQPVYAQEADEADEDEFTLEDIVVTAQKREQLVQDVPIAMTITDAAQMDQQKVYTLQDLARTTPALEFGDTGQGPGGAAVIRGLGTAVFDLQVEPSVGVVVDGVPMGTSNAGNLFDVERVEVLRGPQGTLFGNASSAGVINILTKRPELNVFKGRIGIDATADDTLGSKFGRQEIRAMLNIPVTNNSALRMTVNANLMQDFMRNKAEGTEDQDVKNYGFRVKYLYEPNDDVSVHLIADYTDNNTKGPSLFTIAEIGSDDPLYPYFTGLGIQASDQNQEVYHSNFDFYRNENRFGISAQIDWVMANHDFVSITSYKKDEMGPNSENIFGYEWTHNLLEIKRYGFENKTDTFTQELRVASPADSKFVYLVGLYYNQMERKPEALGTSQLWPPLPPPPFGPPAFLVPDLFPPEPVTTETIVENKNYAVFADGTYPITDVFRVLGGLRYSVYDFSVHNENIIDGTVSEDGIDKGYWSWRAGAQYDVNPETMLYATVTRGVKTPVVSPPPLDDPGGDSTLIQAEIPTSYELGAKLTLFDNKLALDINGFYTDVKDHQGQSCIYNPETQALNCSVINISEVTSKGVEIDIFGQPVDGLTINAGYLYNIAEYPAESGALVGEQLRNAPKNKFTFNAQYERNVTDGLLGFVGFDTVYKSDKRINTDLRPYSVLPSHWMYGARIGIMDSNDKWSLSLFGRNLSSEPEPVAKFGFGQSVVWQILTERDFRQIGLSFNMNF